ncbi:surfeit locus protein 6 homolog [Vanessa cardui]|uniref:surfeit locus protein 6 homolog n=1 Tax=Vanessa cardui TaxID=171605 RepID=UPI001F140616|nr:surfeit locus protein 6 homolog [Vanessa cardui]
MTVQKKSVKNNQLKKELTTELSFLKNVFSVLSIPLQRKDDDDSQMDIEITNESKNQEEKQVTERARNIMELEKKLEKIKSQNNFNLKNKLVKKSLNSKLNKKIKKRERVKLNPNKVKAAAANMEEKETKVKANVNTAKPIFNNEGKLVFSKFDFAKLGEKERGNKSKKDPKKLLDDLKQQEDRLQKLAETDSDKAKELKEKAAWKNILQKAEGEKVKDDPTLLKKSIKKMEQKKKVSKKKWEGRIQSVEKKKEERQQKRKENISKKKKEKKSKIVKAAVKRGRVVI